MPPHAPRGPTDRRIGRLRLTFSVRPIRYFRPELRVPADPWFGRPASVFGGLAFWALGGLVLPGLSLLAFGGLALGDSGLIGLPRPAEPVPVGGPAAAGGHPAAMASGRPLTGRGQARRPAAGDGGGDRPQRPSSTGPAGARAPGAGARAPGGGA
jgi:hypothetical protein